jgi:hypothetical protein
MKKTDSKRLPINKAKSAKMKRHDSKPPVGIEAKRRKCDYSDALEGTALILKDFF